MITNVVAFKASALTLDDTASWSFCIVGRGAAVTTSSPMSVLAPLSLPGGDRGRQGDKPWWPPCLVPAEQSPLGPSPLLHALLPGPPVTCICAYGHPLPHTLNWGWGRWGHHMHVLYTCLLAQHPPALTTLQNNCRNGWSGLISVWTNAEFIFWIQNTTNKGLGGGF